MINFTDKKLNIFLLPLLTAILIFLSYPKISLYPIAFISLTPYIKGIFELESKRQAVIYGILTGFFTYIFILYWIYPTMRAGDVNTFISLISLLVLSLILSIEFIIITIFAYHAKAFGHNMIIIILPAIWTCIDLLKTEITKNVAYFPWFEIAYSQWNNKLLLPIASIGQSYAITFIIIIINILFTLFLIEAKKSLKIKRFISVLTILIISHLFGKFISDKIRNEITNTRQMIKVSIIQPSIDFYMKWDSTYTDFIKSKIENLIKEASSQNPDIIIWPENALYGWIDDKDVFEWLCKTIKGSNTHHLVGSVSKGNAKNVSLYLISPQCEIEGEYHKRILVPFGEYVPLRSFLSKYISVIGSLGEFESGRMDQKPLNFKNITIAPSICYETIFKYLYYPDENINLIINITNDGWYLNTSAPYQHFSAAVFRAVENRRVFVRAANNGISAIINPDGSIKNKLDLNSYGIITQWVEILRISRQTTREKYWACVLSVMIIFAFVISLPLKR